MTTGSDKLRSFVLEAVGEKQVTDVPGIGNKCGKRLSAKGFDKAYVLLGKFLVLRKSRKHFVGWLKMTCGATTVHAMQSYNCLNDYCNAFL